MGLQMRIGYAQRKLGKATTYELIELIAPDFGPAHLPFGRIVG